MRTAIGLCASALAFVLTSSAFAAQSNLLTNGSFEKSRKAKVNSYGFVSITEKTNPDAGIDGWIVNGSVDLNGARYWQQPSGANFSVDLIGSPGAGSIEQIVDIAKNANEWIAGHVYQLTFDLSVSPASNKPKEKSLEKYLRVEILGDHDILLGSADYSVLGGTRTLKNMQWTDQSAFMDAGGNLIFTYTGGPVTVKFIGETLLSAQLPGSLSVASLYCGVAVGNASLTDISTGTALPTPEPMSLAILGMGASALLFQRRRGH
jgi:hypothetical protein